MSKEGKRQVPGSKQEEFHISPGTVRVRKGSLEVVTKFPDGKRHLLLRIAPHDPRPGLGFPAES